jgi:hypothetical protein
MRAALVTNSCSNSTRLGPASAVNVVTPVRLPPGRARLVTSPAATAFHRTTDAFFLSTGRTQKRSRFAPVIHQPIASHTNSAWAGCGAEQYPADILLLLGRPLRLCLNRGRMLTPWFMSPWHATRIVLEAQRLMTLSTLRLLSGTHTTTGRRLNNLDSSGTVDAACMTTTRDPPAASTRNPPKTIEARAAGVDQKRVRPRKKPHRRTGKRQK